MGAGQSQFDEMEEGIRKCTIVIIFLSDAYCKSPNCIREFLHAIKHSKFLIIVLVPDRGPVYAEGPSSGWTGPGAEDKDWWKHANSCSSCRDPDTGDTFTWRALESFPPIDLRVAGGEKTRADDGNGIQEEEQLQGKAELEIIKRIQSRFHRGDHIQNTLEKSYSHWRKAALFDSFDATIDEPDSLRAEVLALFNSMDTNLDGIIDKTELISGFPQIDSMTADSLIAEVDTDADGGISFDELWTMIQDLAAASVRVQDTKTAEKRSEEAAASLYSSLSQKMTGLAHEGEAEAVAAAIKGVDAMQLPRRNGARNQRE